MSVDEVVRVFIEHYELAAKTIGINPLDFYRVLEKVSLPVMIGLFGVIMWLKDGFNRKSTLYRKNKAEIQHIHNEMVIDHHNGTNGGAAFAKAQSKVGTIINSYEFRDRTLQAISLKLSNKISQIKNKTPFPPAPNPPAIDQIQLEQDLVSIYETINSIKQLNYRGRFRKDVMNGLSGLAFILLTLLAILTYAGY